MLTSTRRMATSLLVAGLCSIILAPQARSQAKAVSLEELTRSSDVVAVRQVKNMTSEWDETGNRIRTKVLLSVDQYVVGTVNGNELTLYVPGGEVGTVGELYSHMPVFKQDEQVMVFAARDQQQHYRVSAGEQGKFTIQKDQATGKPMIPGHASLEEFTNQVKSTAQRLQSGDQPNH